MPQLTVDASVVMAVVLNEGHRERLLQLTAGVELLSPPTLSWEVGNALTALFKRRRLTLEEAQAALASYARIVVRLAEIDLTRSVRLAHEQSIYAYDAYVLECARAYRTPLLSLDESQREIAYRLGITVLDIAA